MADDQSPDVSTIDDDIADEPLFGDNTPVTAEPEAPAPSTTEETPKEDGSETEEKTEDDAKTEAEDTPATEETQTDEQADKGKPDPALARQAYLERQRTRQTVEQQITENYAPKTQDELYQENLDKGLDEQQAQYQAEIQAIREEMQYDKQRTAIAELNAGMQAEAVNVEHDFGIYNPKSPEYDAEFTAKVEARYQRVARLQMDDNGLILNAEEPLYDFYKEMAEMYNHSATKGSETGRKEALQTLSRTESVGSSSSTSRGPETLEEMGERLANLPLI